MSVTQHPKLARLLHGTEHQYPTELAVQFDRIFQRIMSLWGSPALDEYFHELLLDDRGDRQGFPSGVVRDLFMLQKLHEDCKLRQHPDDIWADEKWVHCFEERGLDFSRNGFFRALESGDEGAVRLFIEAGVDLELTNAVGWTPLMVAVFMGSEKNAALLINAGARIDCRDRRGYGPLHWAALKGYEIVVQLLVRKGAFVNLKSDKGITPLLQASSCGHANVVRLLLSNRALVSEPDNQGWTPLHKAVANGHVDAIRILVASGADKTAQHTSGETPITIARRRKQPELLQILGLDIVSASAVAS